MSQQIQYNYYNTLATKIDDNTFIFRGKTNVPNLTLSDSRTYVSTKLTIKPSEGTIEIEHEPITNYSKKVIATIPLHLDINSDTAEINLNKLIPKSIRFSVDEMEDAIYLKPETTIKMQEGFCSKKDAKKLKAEMKKGWEEYTNKHRDTFPHGAVGSLSAAELKYLANKLNPLMNDGTIIDGANGDWECSPYDDSAETSTTMGLAQSNNEAKVSNSIYHQAIMNVIIFIAVIFVGNKIVTKLYGLIADKLKNPIMLRGVEMGALLFVIVVVGLLLGIKTPKSGGPARLKAAVSITCIAVFIAYFIHSYRKEQFKASPDEYEKKIGSYISITGFISAGFAGMKQLYEWINQTNSNNVRSVTTRLSS
jgi:hypothetical protein